MKLGKETIVGVGATGALATTRERRGADAAFVAVASRAKTVVHAVHFEKGVQTRAEQDAFVSFLVVRALAEGCGEQLLIDDLERTKVDNIDGVVSHKESVVSCGDNCVDLFLAGEGQTLTFSSGDARGVLDFPHGCHAGTTPIILCGSFNPLHHGHTGLLEAAVAFSGASRPSPLFELSVENVEKSPLDEAALLSRASQTFPHPLVATKAPKFVDKASLFPGAIFVIGYDTMVRLVDPKFYGGKEAEMANALQTIRSRGCSFIVGGRQGEQGQFETFSAKRMQVPHLFRSMFAGMDETAFRQDVSSTAIRRSMGL